MTKTYQATKQLRELTVRVRKKDSSFLYFMLESNEGIAFYSTLDESLDVFHRDIEICATPEFSAQVDNLIEHFQKKAKLEILADTCA